MDEKHGTKLHHVDLAKRRHELENIFDSVINRIPDLCMPHMVRLSGEDDYFNRTKSIKLIPFRKQRAFDDCVSPTDSIKQPTQLDHKFSPDKVPRATLTSSSSTKVVEKNSESKFQQARKVSFKSSPSVSKHVTSSTKPGSAPKDKKVSKVSLFGKTNDPELDRNRKRETRKKLNRRYSRLKIKSKKEGKDQSRLGYDKLFREIPDASYPFANPMPECMLTNDNIDNLREIIVSAVGIEWKMLTPVRPAREYEEKYFDKLIQLHRNRYRSRLESGYFAVNQTAPFKHTRHTYLLHYGAHQRCRSPLSSVAKLKKSFSSRMEHLRSISMRLNIPTLTLTSDETKSSELIESIGDDSEEDDCQEFNYENFSRFSRKNVRFSMESRSGRQQSKERKVSSRLARNMNTSQLGLSSSGHQEHEEGIDFLKSDEILEGRVEEIMSSLMSTQI